MLSIQVRPSLGLLRQIAKIEYFAGSWSRLRLNTGFASDEKRQMTCSRDAYAILCLDANTSVVLAVQLRELLKKGVALSDRGDDFLQELDSKNGHIIELDRLKKPLNAPFALSFTQLLQLHQTLGVAASEHAKAPENSLRQQANSFLDPDGRKIFPGISAFLVEKRLRALLEWTEAELRADLLHPLLVIGTFHLLFLQTLPFKQANHRVALIVMRKLLEAHGYDFVAYSALSPLLLKNEEAYFNALRQAEKTAGSNWSTLNTWLEFFLDSVLSSGNRLQTEYEQSFLRSRLSAVQQQILTVVKEQGSATRERVAQETGINLNTVKYNLTVMHQRGHLRRNGGGRTTNYSLV